MSPTIKAIFFLTYLNGRKSAPLPNTDLGIDIIFFAFAYDIDSK